MAQPRTRVLQVTSINPPHFDADSNLLDWWDVKRDHLAQDQVKHLLEAAHALQTSSIPVAFPTETVYGLGADATRSEAVRGIYVAKQRPSDNPLIVHVGSIDQLRSLLRQPEPSDSTAVLSNGTADTLDPGGHDPIPSIYHPLIHRFWPGPLTLLFPLPSPSPFAEEVTSSHPTVGIRMPSLPLARLLISLSGRPLAAPSANASTRPSPTAAAHVLHDLDGRIELILDGGRCEVGVESTVVDGLCTPPVVLRPGGVGIEEIRRLGGAWADVRIGYRDRTRQRDDADGNGDGGDSSATQNGTEGSIAINGKLCGPRAPGMKYRHYAPLARVHLFEANPDPSISSSSSSSSSQARARAKLLSYHHHKETNPPTPHLKRIGIIATNSWSPGLGFPSKSPCPCSHTTATTTTTTTTPPSSCSCSCSCSCSDIPISTHHIPLPLLRPPGPATEAETETEIEIYSVSLGPDVRAVARGLFSALRHLDDTLGCAAILIEGIRDRRDDQRERHRHRHGQGEGEEGDAQLAAAVMNRLRKAAEG